MASVKEQMNNIKTKDELIKWLINEYFTLSNKVYGKKYDEVLFNEIDSIRDKFDVLNEVEN
ncbi:hypothetical protein [Mammaliicoccus sciuri]|uniref:Uncharacterized protein n=1 Tax=Mammaliicoccus sciuri TaxID=1296 RepID=A0AAJ4VIE8_MAMSC|nr:hypothetical protein [Mammaliicoccus sciuri]MDT0694743.1 hypothetical protein [Mammaliicoccus sciuri]RTX73786.1 hypothetical protein CD117_04145 [Mammaliicoccus sciuri]